jgi:hypothetical protein
MTHVTIERAKLEKVFYALTAAKHGNLDGEWTEEVLAICKQALAKQPMRRVGVVEPLMGTMRTVIWDEGMIPLAGTTLWVKDE